MKKPGPDKWKHFIVGIIIGAVLQAIFWWLLPEHLVLASIITLFVVMAISYGFELFSLITGIGYYDLMDAVAGTLGGIVGMAVIFVLKMKILI